MLGKRAWALLPWPAASDENVPHPSSGTAGRPGTLPVYGYRVGSVTDRRPEDVST
jgi:hypothetical protein